MVASPMKTVAVAPDTAAHGRVGSSEAELGRIDAPERAKFRFGEMLSLTHPQDNIRKMCEHYDNWQRLIFPELWTIRREKRSEKQTTPYARIARARWMSFKSGVIEMLVASTDITTVPLVLCFVATTAFCSEEGNELCTRFEREDLYPTSLNVLSGFLLVFYINQCYLRYLRMHHACSDLQQATMDIVLLAVGTIGDKPNRRPLLLEIWRYANLVHLTSYSGLTQLRRSPASLYTLEHFILPVATAFGEHDDESHQGMLTSEELEELRAWENDDELEGTHFANSMFCAKLYGIVQSSLAHNLTSANWPVWGAALRHMRDASGAIPTFHSDRIPWIYTMLVEIVVRGTLVLDFLALGSSAGFIVRDLSSADDSAVATGSAVVFVTLAVLVLTATLAVIQTLMLVANQMASPLGGDPRDLPVLYHIKDTAKTGLELVLRNERSSFTNPVCLKRVIDESY